MINKKKELCRTRVLKRRHDRGRVLQPASGYDLVAEQYDAWHWQQFWIQNELPLVVERLQEVTTLRYALDLGTGTGRYARILRDHGHKVAAIDISDRMLQQAAVRLGSSQGLTKADVRRTGLSTQYDILTCCRVLSHVPDLEAAFAEFRRVSKRGSRLIVTEVDSRHEYRATRIPVRGRDVLIRVFKHSPNDLIQAAIDNGFRVLSSESVSIHNLHWRPRVAEFPTINWSSQHPLLDILVFERQSS